VCAVCHQRLINRQTFEDQLTMEQTEFERHVAQQRLFHQVEALRLTSERMHLMAQFQMARLGIGRRSMLRRILSLLGWVLVKVFKIVRRALPF
jgi:hypothetical protein